MAAPAPSTNTTTGKHAPQLAPQILAALAHRITEAEFDLPMLPEAATRVIQLSQTDNVDARTLAEVIRRDPALTGHVLRIVNSPYYAMGRKIVSLPQAVNVLGMRAIREIAVAVSCEARMFRVGGHEAELRGLFRHSLAAALFAQEVARRRRWNVEEAFLCGLFHDVGRPVLIQALIDLHKAAGIPYRRDAANEVLREHHPLVGSMVARNCAMPMRICEAVRDHHEPHPTSTATQLVQLADALARIAIDTDGVPAEGALLGHPAAAALNLYPDELSAHIAAAPVVRETVNQYAGA